MDHATWQITSRTFGMGVSNVPVEMQFRLRDLNKGSYKNTGLISQNAARRQGTRSRSNAFLSCLEARALTILFQESLKKDQHHLSKYGKLSLSCGGLLSQKSQVIRIFSATMITSSHSQERTYFDSGDFALSSAHRVTDEGPIQTGRAHPRRESISHPYSPVPATSNAEKDANKVLYSRSASPRGTPSPLRSPSPLHEPTFIGDEKPTNDEEQKNTTVRRD